VILLCQQMMFSEASNRRVLARPKYSAVNGDRAGLARLIGTQFAQ